MAKTGPRMPAPYPFIDVAVHDSIRPRFARGEALVVFSPALDRVLWANGAGARFFGNASIYDFLEEGPSRSDVTFRQIEVAARQLGAVGDSRTLVLRVASGFQRVPVNAVAEMVEIRAGEPVVLLSVPPLGKPGSLTERAADMLTGFDDAKLQKLIDEQVTFAVFFERASLHPNAALITGSICGYRIEEIENQLTRQVRYLDKLVDELAKGRKMEKILRSA